LSCFSDKLKLSIIEFFYSEKLFPVLLAGFTLTKVNLFSITIALFYYDKF
jgi:hypothetical protein